MNNAILRPIAASGTATVRQRAGGWPTLAPVAASGAATVSQHASGVAIEVRVTARGHAAVRREAGGGATLAPVQARGTAVLPIQNYFVYEVATGRILANYGGRMSDLESGTAWMQGSADDEEYYVLNGAPVARPANPVTVDKEVMDADGIDKVTFSNIPAGTTVNVYGEVGGSVVVNDGVFELSSDDVGRSTVAIDSFPEVVVTFNIEAV